MERWVRLQAPSLAAPLAYSGRRRWLYRRAIDSVELGPQGAQALPPRAL
jgi:hypothetical protein